MRPVERLGRFVTKDVWEAGAERMSRPRRAFARARPGSLHMTVEGFADDLCTTPRRGPDVQHAARDRPRIRAHFRRVARARVGGAPAREADPGPRHGALARGDRDGSSRTSTTSTSPGSGVFGAAFLFVTFVSMVSRVESAFNAIWDHAPRRTIGRRIVDYFGVVVVAPVLVAVAVSFTAAIRELRRRSHGSAVGGLGAPSPARWRAPRGPWSGRCSRSCTCSSRTRASGSSPR